MDHDDNVVGAAILLVADRMRTAIEAATGRTGGQPVALTALHGWADGHSIDELARGLGLSHSRTVRVIDALVEQGFAQRVADPLDRRHVLVELTEAGAEAATAVLQARAEALRATLSALPAQQRAAVAAAAESILYEAIGDRSGARLACRLCDVHACGHADGRCPATRAADDWDPAEQSPTRR